MAHKDSYNDYSESPSTNRDCVAEKATCFYIIMPANDCTGLFHLALQLSKNGRRFTFHCRFARAGSRQRYHSLVCASPCLKNCADCVKKGLWCNTLYVLFLSFIYLLLMQIKHNRKISTKIKQIKTYTCIAKLMQYFRIFH